MSCTCHSCEKQYKVDLIVPDDVWNTIKPDSSDEGAGLLCPTCITEGIEKHYGYFALNTRQPKFLFCSQNYFNPHNPKSKKYTVRTGITYEVLHEDDDYVTIRDNFNQAFKFAKHKDAEWQDEWIDQNKHSIPSLNRYLRELTPKELKGTVWDKGH